MMQQPLLGSPADLKADRSTSTACKATVCFTLCVLSVGAVCYPQGRIQEDSAAIPMSVLTTQKTTELIGSETSKDFMGRRNASSACETANPTLVAAVTVVLSLYVLFFFAPFYMFPEAAIALGAWKLYPLLEKDIMASPKDTDVPDAMREALFLTMLLGFVSRCFTLWTERNEAKAAGRQSSMLWSIIVGFVIFVVFNVVSA